MPSCRIFFSIRNTSGRDYFLFDHFSTLWTIFLFPSFSVSGKIPSVDAQISSLQKPITFSKPITQQERLHFLDQNNRETTSWKTKYLVTHCFKKLSNLLFHAPPASSNVFPSMADYTESMLPLFILVLQYRSRLSTDYNLQKRKCKNLSQWD